MAEKVADFYGVLGMRIDDGSFAKANEILGTIKNAVIAFAGFKVVQGVVGAIADVVEAGGNLADTSAKTGVAAETLQEYSYAAGLAGVASDGLTSSLTKLNKGLAEAASSGKGPVADGLKAIGIGLKDPAVKAQNLDEILLEIADKFAEMPDGPKKVAAAMDLFGKTGADLIPFLNAGGDGIAKLKQEACELGVVIDNDTVAALDDFGDNIDRVKAGWQGVKNQAVAAILPLLSDMMPGLIAVTKDAVAWVKDHKEEIKEFVETTGRAIKYVIQALVAVGQFLARVFKAVGTAIGQGLAWLVLKAQAAAEVFMSAWNAVKDGAVFLWNKLVEVGTAIVDGFVTVGTGIKNAFQEAFNWVINKAREVAETIGNLPVIKQLGSFGRWIGGKLATDVNSGFEMTKEARQRENPGQVYTREMFDKEQAAAAAASTAGAPSAPSPAATSSSAAMSQSVAVTNSITVTPGPGMDEKALASKVGEVVDERMTNIFRHAMANEGVVS